VVAAAVAVPVALPEEAFDAPLTLLPAMAPDMAVEVIIAEPELIMPESVVVAFAVVVTGPGRVRVALAPETVSGAVDWKVMFLVGGCC
jgi:hypothetical protein